MKFRTLGPAVFLLTMTFLLWPRLADAQFYRGTQMEFGKNRVQYGDFYWRFYRFKNFDAYAYKGGEPLAEYVGRVADKELTEIERFLDYGAEGRLQFIVFNKQADMKQTNIGLQTSDDLNNIGGVTRIVGNKILIYFDGDHEHFRMQIREGIAAVLIDQLMYGGSIKDRLQSSVLLNLPTWYVQGLISYIAYGWTSDDDNRMRDGILNGRYVKFNRMLDNEAVFAGHSLWHYIARTYGEASIANLLYMTRINRNIESGFLYVLGVSLKALSDNWIRYNQKIYLNADQGRTMPAGEPIIKKPKKKCDFYQIRLSPDGRYLVYATNEIGKYSLYLKDLESGKRKRLAKGGYKSLEQSQDKSFPAVAWHPNGRTLSFMIEKKGGIYLNHYQLKEKKKEKSSFFYFEKVLNFSYSPDGQKLVMSAIQKGQSDIFEYHLRMRNYTNITNDLYDDFEPVYIDNGDAIMFSSNRLNDTLGVDLPKALPAGIDRNIFIYDLANEDPVLRRVTVTPGINEISPLQIDSGKYSYLSDYNGIYNRYIFTLNKVISHIDTAIHYRYEVKTWQQEDYARNVEEHHVNARFTKYAELVYDNGRYYIYVNPVPPFNTNFGEFSDFINESETEIGSVQEPTSGEPKKVLELIEEPREEKKQEGKIDINNYVFESEFSNTKSKSKTDKLEKESERNTQVDRIYISEPGMVNDTLPFNLPKLRNYDIAFSAAYFVSQLDNNLLNNTYQAYTGGAVYFDPGLNGLFKVGLTDLFDDYKITGGFRLSGNLTSNEYFLSYENLKKRIDKQISFYRAGREEVNGLSYFRIHTHEAKYQLRYPFNDLMSLRGSASLRSDRFVTLSTDLNRLQVPDTYTYWGSLKLEFVYDNTLNTGLNLMNGTRYKLFAEYFNQIEQRESNLGVIGLDIRNYLKIHRQIIWANRLAASTSFGATKLVYYLGSEDNAIVPVNNFNQSVRVDESQNYAFQALATNMRGFIQNVRNGNSFALINSEIRIPVFSYIINRPIRSDFVRNFQTVAFFDIGTAWTGSSPYGDDNALNVQDIQSGPFTISLNKQIEPVVAGYGFGLRSRIFGYFMRGSWAWGYEDGQTGDSIFYFSLGLDF